MRLVKATAGGRPQAVNLIATTLTRGGAGNLTATFTCPFAHGLSTGDKVYVRGADKPAFNALVGGAPFIITVTSATVFTYTMTDDPGSDANVTNVRAHKGLGTDQYEPWVLAHPESQALIVEHGGAEGGRFGGRSVVNGDGTVNGRWSKIVVLSAGTITTLTGNLTVTTPLTVAVGAELRGDFTAIAVSAGTVVIAYNSQPA